VLVADDTDFVTKGPAVTRRARMQPSGSAGRRVVDGQRTSAGATEMRMQAGYTAAAWRSAAGVSARTIPAVIGEGLKPLVNR